MSEPQGCIFCRIAQGEAPASVVLREGGIVAFMDLFPSSRGHVLVVPERHAETIWELREEEGARLFAVTVRLAGAIRQVLQPAGLNVLQSNGRAAGQEVFHFHVHLIPRYGGSEGLRFHLRDRGAPPTGRAELDALAQSLGRALAGR